MYPNYGDRTASRGGRGESGRGAYGGGSGGSGNYGGSRDRGYGGERSQGYENRGYEGGRGGRGGYEGGRGGYGGGRGGRGGDRGGRGGRAGLGGPAPVLQSRGPVEVVSNHYSMTIDSKQPTTLYKHLVSIKEISAPDDPVRKEKRIEVVTEAMTKNGVVDYAYDGDTLIISQSILAITETVYGRFDLLVSNQDEIDLGNATSMARNEDTTAQVLDIIMKQAAKETHEELHPRKFFPKNTSTDTMVDLAPLLGRRRDDGGAKSVWLGHFQSSCMSKEKTGDKSWSVLLNVVSSVSFDTMPFVDFLAKELKLKPRWTIRDIDFRKANRIIKGLKVETWHCPAKDAENKRTYKALQLVDMSADQHVFPHEDKDISLADYFKARYGMAVRTDFPLLQVNPLKKKTYLPIDGVYISRQKFSGNIPENIKSAVGNLLTMAPKDRHDCIQKARDETFTQNQILERYGITIGRNMLNFNATVIVPPVLCYSESGRPESFKPLDVAGGKWNMMKMGFTRPSAVTNWSIIDFGSGASKHQLEEFEQELMKEGKRLNMKMAPPKLRHQIQRFESNSQLQDIVKKLPDRPQLIVCLFPERDQFLYTSVKSFFENRCATQCLTAEKTPFIGPHPYKGNPSGHLANILSKINQKCMGSNQKIYHDRCEVDAVRKFVGKDRSCMVLGADITHATGAGARKRHVPSIAGLVGSLDDDLTVYGHAARCQDASDEVVQGIPEMLEEILATRKRRVKELPNRVIYFRDGVSDSQMASVLEKEVAALSGAFHALGANPAILAIIVQKRHQTRFFPKDSPDARTNLPPGTVIKDNLTHPSEWDNFYLLSHAGIKGTSRPARYFILRNDISRKYDVPEKELIHFIYQMCHLQGRCQRTVSLPAPVYYAQLLLERCRILVKEAVREGTEGRLDISSDAGSSDAGGAFTLAEREEVMKIGNNLLKSLAVKSYPMFYC
eukprot:GHVO01013374.1.p1 GENE.GHVO01013374.1~~GHVO01013374.1.p1  ORF type:complete len:954 (+),score=173.32 GHVO01013374.1:163-3024(+)